MNQQYNAGNDALMAVLKAKLSDSREQKQRFEKELSELRVEYDAAQSLLIKHSGAGAAQTPKGTFIGKLFGNVGGMGRIQELQKTKTETAARIEKVRSLIQDQDHCQEKAIDDYLLATDEHYRKDSMRWSAVMRLKHGLELYGTTSEQSRKSIQDVKTTESIRRSQGRTPRTEQELLSHQDAEKAVLDIKVQLDAVVAAAEDVLTHDAKAACKLTITYHGGTMSFDLYAHPTHLSLYQIDTLDDAIKQLEGLCRAIKAALAHVEEMSRRALAERLRYRNRIHKSL